jgi:hypothetical protein
VSVWFDLLIDDKVTNGVDSARGGCAMYGRWHGVKSVLTRVTEKLLYLLKSPLDCLSDKL